MRALRGLMHCDVMGGVVFNDWNQNRCSSFLSFVLCVCVFCFMMCCYYLTKSSLFTAHSFVGFAIVSNPRKSI